MALREFFLSVQAGKDTEASWKKQIYKIIQRYDESIPENFKTPEFLRSLEWSKKTRSIYISEFVLYINITVLSSDIADYNQPKPKDTLQTWSLEANFLLILKKDLRFLQRRFFFMKNASVPWRSQIMFVCDDCMNDCMNVCLFVSIHLYINTSLYRNLYRLIKMRPSEPKILKIALIHEIVCICSIFLCRPPFLQIQSNNSLGNIFFFVLFLCCISHVQKNYFSLLTFSPPPVLSSSDLCTNSNEKKCWPF